MFLEDLMLYIYKGYMPLSLHIKIFVYTHANVPMFFFLIHLLWNKFFLQWSQRPWTCMHCHIYNLQLLFLIVLINGCPKVGWTHLHWSLTICMKLKHLGMLLWGCLKCMKLMVVPCFFNFKWFDSPCDCFCERWGQQF
jgi:hypothetical protein